ncbi:MAG: hypothetical protein V1875_00070 [Candidatus Altiarchaeota archaeon]
MGDYDSELYNTANYIHNEIQGMHEVLKDINRNLAALLQEMKAMREDQMRK